jgi:hypothetical protein
MESNKKEINSGASLRGVPMKASRSAATRVLCLRVCRILGHNWRRNLGLLIAPALIFPGALRAIKASSHGQQPAAGLQLMAGPGPAFSTQSASARQAAGAQHDMAALGGPVTVHARGTGNPRISFDDGRQLLTSFTGAAGLQDDLASRGSRPLALASADLDEDGVPDLLSGFATADGRGIIAVYPGNVDSIYPNSPEARRRKLDGTFTNAPFLSPARLFGLPSAPDFLETGNFEGTHRLGVVAATSGSNILYVMDGDGSGGLGTASEIALPGRVTAMASGDVNRADGLKDIVLALDCDTGPELLVFEGPEGALKSTPEAIPIPAMASSLGIGHLDDDFLADIAVTSGHDLMMIHGRDRMLYLDQTARSAVAPARISNIHFKSAPQWVTVGKFSPDGAVRMAVLTADGSLQSVAGDATPGRSGRYRVVDTMAAGLEPAAHMVRARFSGMASDDLMILDRSGRAIGLWMNDAERKAREANLTPSSQTPQRSPALLQVEGEPAAVLPMRLNSDALDDLVVLISGRSGPSIVPTACSPGQPCQNITVTSALDDGSAGTLRVAINTANGGCGIFCDDSAGAVQPTTAPTPTTISFAIMPTSLVPTISLQSPLPTLTGTVTIDGTTQAAGLVELNGENMISDAIIIQSPSNVVRGMVINRSGNGIQATQGGSNIIEGNLIGTDPTGTTVRGNTGRGVLINNSSNNTIGGTASPSINVISGNQNGIELAGNGSVNNVVELNLIGADKSLSLVLGNSQNGLSITNGASNNIIGGTAAPGSLLNVIVGSHQDGVSIASGTSNLVQSNQIDLNSRNGLLISSPGNTVGGLRTLTINGVWRNGGNGVELLTTFSNVVQGNYIGVNFNASGAPVDMGNTLDGVNVAGSMNKIGGLNPSSLGNIIAFNHGNGVSVLSGNGDSILSDLIFSNAGTGIFLAPGANDNLAAPKLTAAFPSGSTSVTAASIAPAAAPGVMVTGTVTGPDSQPMLVQFFLGTACVGMGDDQMGVLPVLLGSLSVTTDSTGSASFSVTLPLPAGSPATGFVNASATDPGGSTSSFSQCTAFGASSCAITCPASFTVSTPSTSGTVAVNYDPPGTAGCTGAVTCDHPSGSLFDVGKTTTVTCTATDSLANKSTCTFLVTVTQSALAPILINPFISGRKFVTTASGSNIVTGAVLVDANSVDQTNPGGQSWVLEDGGSGNWVVFKFTTSTPGGKKFKKFLNQNSGGNIMVFARNPPQPNGATSATVPVPVP